MVNFPGEDKDVPKRIVEAIGKQPLSHLVPKEGLTSLIAESMTASIALENDLNESIFEKNDITNITKSEVPTLQSINHEKLEFVFKYPENLQLGKTNSKQYEIDFLKDLSPNALKYLIEKNINVSSKNIQKKDSISEKKSDKKHTVVDEETENLIDSQPTKRTKISSNVSLNQENIAFQYMKDLEILMNQVGKTESDSDTSNLEHWHHVANEHYTLNELSLNKFVMTLRNILKLPQLWPKLNVDDLFRILNIMVSNIKLSNKYCNSEYDSNLLKRIAYLSICVIFNILLFNREDKKLHLEQFLLEPIDFLAESIELIKESTGVALNEVIQLFDQAIVLIPTYINQISSLDEGLVSRFTYVFSDILMNYELELSADFTIQNSWKNIKTSCSNILIALFEKVPNQRNFLLDELLSHVENLPQKRVQKALRKVENGVYITDFTLTILGMLETVNYFTYIDTIKDIDDDIMETLEYNQKISTGQLKEFTEHINDSLINRMFENLSKYRHCLENFIHDLINIIENCLYPASEWLLYSLMKKLLAIFGPSKNYHANIETICLQLLGKIGGAIFDIKSKTKDDKANTLIKLCNYPNMLPKWLSSFSVCTTYIMENTSRASSWQYMYCIEIDTLLHLRDLMKDSSASNETTNAAILNAIRDINGVSKTKVEDYSSESVRDNYFSILHSFKLLNLYEPYLKLILSILDKDKIKLRSVAIKCLSILASKDNNVLSSPMVKSTIADLLSNSSAASIKDAVLDLVSIGSFYLQFYKEININYDADSLQVRRHILKINEKVYDETDDIDTKIFVSSKILLKIEDEEDVIIDIAKEILLKKWLLDLKEYEYISDKQQYLCYQIIETLAGVVLINEKCTNLFTWFLNFYLLNNSLHSSTTCIDIKNGLNILTNALVQMIIELQSRDLDGSDLTLKKGRLLNLLSIFSDSIVSFITKDHIMGLYPYMVTDTKSNLYYHILHTFRKSIEKGSNFKPNFLYDLETALLTALPKMTVKEMDEAIPLAWCVANHRSDYGRIAKACSSCFTHLNPYITNANTSPEQLHLDGKLQRLLYLAAGFARFCQFNTSTLHISYIQERELIYEYVAKCMLIFSKNDVNHVIRRIAIKNLTKLCGNHPRLFNSKHILKVLDKEFASSHLDIQLVILESFYDFFTQEEKRTVIETGETKFLSSGINANGKAKRNTKRESSNDGICTALVARYRSNILTICLVPDFKDALVAIRLLKLIFEYGYTNPSPCIPTVVALLSTTNSYMSSISIEIFTNLVEKYESMVYSGLSKGIQMAVKYSKDINGINYYQNDKFLILLQKYMTNNKGQITKFNKRIFKIINVLFASVLSEPSVTEKTEMVLYLSTNIALMKFQNQFELLSLIKNMDVISEQIKELTYDEGKINLDNIDLENDRSEKQKLQNMIITATVLEELKNYLIQIYGMKDDILLFERTEESELRNKPATINRIVPYKFETLISQTISLYNNTTNMIDYLQKLD